MKHRLNLTIEVESESTDPNTIIGEVTKAIQSGTDNVLKANVVGIGVVGRPETAGYAGSRY